MPGILIQETYVNATREAQFGATDVYETFTDDKGALFRHLQREYGRCVSKVYIDQQNGPPKAIGWVFEKRMQYEDARGNDPERDFYTRQVWITIHERKPEIKRTEFLADVDTL